MRYHWLRDRENQKQFDIYWKPGVQNHADYWTKHHPVLHHRSMRAKYVQDHDIKQKLYRYNMINSSDIARV